MPETIDYPNDELLLTPDEKPKAAETPVLARAFEMIERINAFVAETGVEPMSQPGRSVRERILANELSGLRASKANLEGLASYDTHNLDFGAAGIADPLDDPLLSDGLDIFDLRDELRPMARPEFVADRRPCPDFDRFQPLFENVRNSVERGTRTPQPFRQERVELGEFFVLKGQLVHVADLRDEHRRNGKPDARLRVIFDNGTDSNLVIARAAAIRG